MMFSELKNELSWYVHTLELAKNKMNSIWLEGMPHHFYNIMSPVFCEIFHRKGKAYMIFVMPDAEIFKYT